MNPERHALKKYLNDPVTIAKHYTGNRGKIVVSCFGDAIDHMGPFSIVDTFYENRIDAAANTREIRGSGHACASSRIPDSAMKLNMSTLAEIDFPESEITEKDVEYNRRLAKSHPRFFR